MTHYFFCGIGGSGMSALAQAVKAGGHQVSGSDRSYDQEQTPDKFAQLEQLGFKLYPQDGSGIQVSGADTLVVSTAVEATIPDVKAAQEQNLTIIKRAELLAQIVNNSTGICVGGTSGKSTTTGMLGHILFECSKNPTVINGAVMQNVTTGLGNCLMGSKDLTVIEADESDGSIALYQPAIAIVNNITLDHKPIEELRPLFSDFVAKARIGAVINLDCVEANQLTGLNSQTRTFSLTDENANFTASDIQPEADGVSFLVNDRPARLRVPGRHNISNALSAIAAGSLLGIPLEDMLNTLPSFQGIKRRLEPLGQAGGVAVIDDFAHNPDKIEASLNTLQEYLGRVLVMYQPHGFGPTKMLKDGLIKAFVDGLKADDHLYMPEILYVGGTADKSISSNDLIQEISSSGKNATFTETRDEIADKLVEQAQNGDRIVIMGARDDSLTIFAKDIMKRITDKALDKSA